MNKGIKMNKGIPTAVLDQVVRQQEELSALKAKVRELVDAAKDPYYHDTIGPVGRAYPTYPARLLAALAAVEKLL